MSREYSTAGKRGNPKRKRGQLGKLSSLTRRVDDRLMNNPG